MPESLPKNAKSLWEEVHNKAIAKGDSEASASKQAWGAIKRAGWRKSDNGWVKDSDLVPEFSMYFSKVNTNNRNWAMVASDTLLDRRGEAMSLDLYKDFTQKIENSIPVPEPFSEVVCSEYWKGGKPYLSIAHYSDLNGDGIPGEVERVYVDGNQLKAKGAFNDTPLGETAWKALIEDKSNVNPEGKIRVSIAFLDLAHKHGDFVFERKSFDDVCPMCIAGAGNKVYLKGHLVHMALTRKPVNPRSEIEVQLSMSNTTRKEDAASIVGSLADELDEKQKALVGKSDVIVERADTPDEDKVDETVAPVEEVVSEEPESVPEPEETPQEEVVTEESDGEYAGPITMKEMVAEKAAQEEFVHVMDMWGMFTNVVWNIFDSSAVTDKKGAVSKALDEFKSTLATKSLVQMFSETAPEVITEPKVETPLSQSLQSLEQAFNEQVSLVGSNPQARLMAIQPALDALGETIKSEVDKVVDNPVTVQSDTVSNIDEKIREATQPILEALSLLTAKLDQRNVEQAPIERARPQPRSVNPLTVRSLTQQQERKLSPIDAVVRQSVGLGSE